MEISGRISGWYFCQVSTRLRAIICKGLWIIWITNYWKFFCHSNCCLSLYPRYFVLFVMVIEAMYQFDFYLRFVWVDVKSINKIWFKLRQYIGDMHTFWKCDLSSNCCFLHVSTRLLACIWIGRWITFKKKAKFSLKNNIIFVSYSLKMRCWTNWMFSPRINSTPANNM